MTRVRAAVALWSLTISSKPVGEDVSDKNSEELSELTGRSEPIELGVPGIDVWSALTKSCEMEPIELKLSTRAGAVVSTGCSVVGSFAMSSGWSFHSSLAPETSDEQLSSGGGGRTRRMQG